MSDGFTETGTRRMTPAERDDLRRKAKVAEEEIPGPWRSTHEPNDECCWSAHVETVATGKYGHDHNSIADVGSSGIAAFIAACDPQTVIGLLDEIEKIEKGDE